MPSNISQDIDQSSSERNKVVNSFSQFPGSDHKINKNAFNFSLQKTAGSNELDSEIGFNLGSVTTSEYTVMFELYLDPPAYIFSIIASTPRTLSINFEHSEKVDSYFKTIVKFNKSVTAPDQFLYFTLKGDLHCGSSEGHLIIYGIGKVYDQLFKISNDKMQLQTDIDANNKKKSILV